ncbi:heterokaryon incompatibility protein-domain-containing protein [Dactylonectria macrodidyma]|uniref:Heterokaryon incompatibility protein-domain-containing protein n=1 Tax=Dactylonectria macrodidyma TaxID=307937 RepID=A0A9P9I8Y9_9HYPO|nr:heterokaryon incompatibility protein-domain-containing protein [Dactylonectria macrodidyma]
MAERGALFDVTFGELCTGAAAGCQLLNWIMDDEWISSEIIHSLAQRDMIIDDPNQKLGWAFKDSSLWFDGWLGEPCPENTLHKIRPSLGDSLNQCRLWASTYQGTGNPLDIEFIQFFGLWDPVTQKIVYRTRHGFQAFAQPEDPSSRTVSNRPIARYPGSSTNLVRMSSWLNHCQEHHNCKTMPGVMPTRLIEITGTPETISLRLRQTEEVGRVPFAALSYCWGGEQPMKCLSSNIVSYGTAIPFEKQPPTIKDAAKVCQGMGLQYLWIDALCIIQDDSNDKSVEIAKMPSIYGSATVTIAAARSSSATEGFLGERFPGPRGGAIVSYRCMDGELGSITLVKLDDGGFESVEPIDERGWTLQERLLSSRIIEFGSRQTRWICPEIRSSGFSLEGFTDGWKRDVNFSSKRKTEALDLENIRTAKSTIDFYGRPRDSKFQEYLNSMEHWETICETFTERALTLSSDRVLAISGIAQIFARLSGDQYIAGLWKSCFHSGLLWKIQHSHLSPKNIPQPTTYQGPSWSWLSVNGPVNFGQVCRPSECVAEILSCETEPANETAPYGLIREGSGRLVLAARTAPGIRTKVPLRSPGKFKDEVMILGFGESVVCYATAEMHCDVKEAKIDEEEEAAGCLVVEISRRNDGDKLSCQGLVLRWSSPERKTYSRVGRFSYYGDRKGRLFAEHIKDGQSAELEFDWFTDEPKVIEII